MPGQLRATAASVQQTAALGRELLAEIGTRKTIAKVDALVQETRGILNKLALEGITITMFGRPIYVELGKKPCDTKP